MQKPVSIFLLLLFSYFSFGYSLHLFAKLYSIRTTVKHELKKEVPKSKLHTFELSPLNVGKNVDGFVWVHPKEFKLNGQYYDVVYADTLTESIVLQCVDDEQETKLFKDLQYLVLKKHQENKQEKSTHIAFVQLLSVAYKAPFEMRYYLQEIGICNSSVQHQQSVAHCTRFTPPPELIFILNLI